MGRMLVMDLDWLDDGDKIQRKQMVTSQSALTGRSRLFR